MNAKDAFNIGEKDGRIYLNVLDLSRTSMLAISEHFARDSYRAQSEKTVNQYVAGFTKAWEAAQIDKLMQPAPIVVEHNPNTRFCCCSACQQA